MNNVSFVEVEGVAGLETHAIIDKGNGEYTSMPKSIYDEMIAQQEHLTENPTAQQLKIMIKYLKLYKQRYFNCRKGKHIYYGIPSGTACLACNWKEI